MNSEILYHEDKNKLLSYKIEADNKQHEFWQRDSLAILLYSRDVAFQKLDYIHYNPVAEQWQLVKDHVSINILRQHTMN